VLTNIYPLRLGADTGQNPIQFYLEIECLSSLSYRADSLVLQFYREIEYRAEKALLGVLLKRIFYSI
jgi:hypothetical protein